MWEEKKERKRRAEEGQAERRRRCQGEEEGKEEKEDGGGGGVRKTSTSRAVRLAPCIVTFTLTSICIAIAMPTAIIRTRRVDGDTRMKRRKRSWWRKRRRRRRRGRKGVCRYLRVKETETVES